MLHQTFVIFMRFPIACIGLVFATFRVCASVCHTVFHDTYDNALTENPTLECQAQNLLVNFKTKKPFEGHVFVKGHFDKANCKTDATLLHSANISIPFTFCDVQRKRSMFITKIDKSFHVQCFYKETAQTVETHLNVSLHKKQENRIVVVVGDDAEQRTQGLEIKNVSHDYAPHDPNSIQTELISQRIPLPACQYKILDGGPKGNPVKYVSVGQQVYHQWSCSSTSEAVSQIYCMTVHSCIVKETTGKEVQILDEDGCALDRYLFENLEYTSNLVAGQISRVFKFADQSSLYFHCQIRMTVKRDVCERTSDHCRKPNRGKRSTSLTTNSTDDDVDVYSQPIVIFDVGDAEDFQGILPVNESVPLSIRSELCISPLIFGMMVLIFVVTLLISTLVTAASYCKSKSLTFRIAEYS